MLSTWHSDLTSLMTAQGYTEGFPISTADQKTHYYLYPESIDSLPFSDGGASGSAKFENVIIRFNLAIFARYNKNNFNAKVREMEAICEDLLKAINSYDNWSSDGRYKLREIPWDVDFDQATIFCNFKIEIDGTYTTD